MSSRILAFVHRDEIAMSPLTVEPERYQAIVAAVAAEFGLGRPSIGPNASRPLTEILDLMSSVADPFHHPPVDDPSARPVLIPMGQRTRQSSRIVEGRAKTAGAVQAKNLRNLGQIVGQTLINATQPQSPPVTAGLDFRPLVVQSLSELLELQNVNFPHAILGPAAEGLTRDGLAQLGLAYHPSLIAAAEAALAGLQSLGERQPIVAPRFFSGGPSVGSGWGPVRTSDYLFTHSVAKYMERVAQ